MKNIAKSLEDKLVKLPNSEIYKTEHHYKLKNGKISDLVLFINNKINSLWKFEEKIEGMDEERKYFHQSQNPFHECGIHSDFWIFYDGEKYVLNDHAYIYPFDEHFDNLKDLFKRMDRKMDY